MHNQQLKSLLHFTDEDLTMNKQGQLSEKQTERLQKMAMRTVYTLMGFALIFAVLIYFGAQSPVVAALLLLFVAFVARREYRRSIKGITAGTVEHVSGVVYRRRVSRGSDDRFNYYLKVNETTFKVGEDTFSAFEDGQRYRIYYTPLNKFIISAEAMR